MTDHAAHAIQRHCDVAVVGGSAAGLAAALQLGRQRRSVIVIDAGEPRNASAAHMHGYLTREGAAPSEVTSVGREDVRSYGGEVLDGRVLGVTRDDDGRLRLDLVGGHAVVARRLLIATGLVDELPDIAGVAEHWGRDVIHCPFCHGYEFRDQRVVQVVTHPLGLHTAALWRQLTSRLTVVLHNGAGVDEGALAALKAGGVAVHTGPVSGIVTGADGSVAGVRLADGTGIGADVVALGPRVRVRVEPFAGLGVQAVPHASGFGEVVETDPMGATSVPGVYAAGNVTDPSQQVLQAAAAGGRIGAMVSFSLAEEDLEAATRPSAHQSDWDHRYGGERMWSGNPNGSLVNQISSVTPGRALDVGAGEGGDAVWLAQNGWKVTANDISERALDRVRAEADRRGLQLEYHRADANDWEAFEPDRFDLVSAQYAAIPRTPDRRGVHNLMRAVAPGGRLLVVGHDLAPMRAPIDTQTQSRAFDPDAYLRTDDFAATLADSADWDIELHERRTRPLGAASASHHVDDIILRARRRQS